MTSDSHRGARRLPPGVRRTILPAIITLLAAEVIAHWIVLEPLEQSRLLTIGGIAECAIWLLLFGVLTAVQLRTLPKRIHALLSSGLSVWLVSQTADLMDEFLRQPLWISVYGEDIARVLGMFLTSFGVLALIRHSASTMQELETLSYRDSLTGLGNRRKFGQMIDARGTRRYSLLMLDLDHFKSVNDEFGHEVGDRVLREIAGRLAERFSSEAQLFRLGGEEFAMLFDAMDQNGLLRVGEHVREAVGSYRSDAGASLTVSIGAGTRAPSELPGHLMRRVDRALYRAKDSGRDRVKLAE